MLDAAKQSIKDTAASAARGAKNLGKRLKENVLGTDEQNDDSASRGFKKGGKVMEHKHHVEHVKKHASGHQHEQQKVAKHSAGHKLHHEHVKSMCGGGKAK